MRQAKELYAQAKRDVVNYHTVKDASGLTGYEQEIAVLCQRVKDYFQNRSVTPGDSVVFDIDETVLSNVNLSIEENFETKRGTDTNYIFRSQARCTPIVPSIDLCSWLRTKGYKVIFITSRRDWMAGYREGTVVNLEREGVRIDPQDGLFLLEQWYNEGPEKISIGAWKRLVRDQLRAKGYTIVACVGDDDGDLAMPDERNVLNVKFPNYLY